MKKLKLILVLSAGMACLFTAESCKNKSKTESTQQNQSGDVPVIAADDELRASVDVVIKNYEDVKADVKDGIVTLRGKIKQSELQDLIMKVQELRPKKVENKLEIE